MTTTSQETEVNRQVMSRAFDAWHTESGNVIGASARGMDVRVSGPTSASTWYAASGAPISDRLLEWPPDVFALTNVVLARPEAFRHILSQARDWPPSRYGGWAHAVAEAGRRWSAWAEDRAGAMPDLVAAEFGVLREGAEVPLEHLAVGRDHRVCEALLTLHAIADEARAGLVTKPADHLRLVCGRGRRGSWVGSERG